MQAMEAALLKMISSCEGLEGGPQSILHNIPNPESVPPTWKKALRELFANIKVMPEMRIFSDSYSMI